MIEPSVAQGAVTSTGQSRSGDQWSLTGSKDMLEKSIVSIPTLLNRCGLASITIRILIEEARNRGSDDHGVVSRLKKREAIAPRYVKQSF
jgi:hypothetical protein